MDPYKILGVSRSATSDEVKKAYRELSKKYHPDAHMNNPLSELAEEKFKEVQLAYQEIMDELEGKATQKSYYSSNQTYGSGRSNDGGADSPELNKVYQLLNNRQFIQAIEVLQTIPNKTARWFYCSAIAQNGAGNNILAYDYARQAVNLEPGNVEYANLLNQMQFRQQRYQSTGYNNGRGLSTGNLCCDLWCADSLCECMGGDLCLCC